jgi:hypothetical protein
MFESRNLESMQYLAGDDHTTRTKAGQGDGPHGRVVEIQLKASKIAARPSCASGEADFASSA